MEQTQREYSGKISLAASQYGKERDYWLEQLSGNLIKTRFPITRNITGEIAADTRQTVKITCPAALSARLLKISKGSEYMLHMILTAGLAALLDKYTYDGNGDIIVGIPIYKQETGTGTGTGTRGKLLNTALAIRNRIHEGMSFKQLLIQVRQAIVEADENQNYPIETLVYQLGLELSPGQFPLFDVAILLENIHEPGYIEHTQPNMVFSFNRTGEAMAGRLEYNPRYYRESMAAQISRHFTCLLEAALDNLDAALPGIDILSGREKLELLYEFNDTDAPYPHHKTIHRLYAEQADQTPDRAAVINETGSLTYKTLHRSAQDLAAVLRAKGLKEEEAVAIMAERSIGMAVGILAILEAGGAYLPIDPDYPGKRKKYIIADSGARIMLTDGSETCPGVGHVIRLTGHDRPGQPREPLETGKNRDPGRMAYIIYTSGSTGESKGVMVRHRSVVRLVKNTNFIDIQPEDRVLQTGALDFDASTFEIWGSLLNGLQLIMVDRETILTPGTLKETITKQRATIMWMTSALFNRMLEADIEIFNGIRALLVGGDVLSIAHINRVREQYPRLKVINGYGPTENTTFSLTHVIERNYTGSIPIGKPIANSTAYIIHRHNRLAPVGVPGELLVGGDGVASGYLNNPQLTAEKFDHDLWHLWDYPDDKKVPDKKVPDKKVPDKKVPDKKVPGKRIQIIHRSNKSNKSNKSYNSYILYKTGDLTRWLPGGIIEFLGRIDQQVKIRGYRIEPGEIENRLGGIDGIKDAVVITRRDKQGEKYLCAYIVTAAAGPVDTHGIRAALGQHLPDYMVPAYYVSLEKIPLTPNGKVDKNALPEPGTGEAGIDRVPPGNTLEKKLVKLWSGVLGVKEEFIGIDHDFFELGGHSLKATMLIAEIHKALNVKVPLAEIFRTPFIRELARYIRGKEEIKYTAIKPVEKKEYYPLSSAQKRLYILQRIQENAINYNVPQFAELEGNLDEEKLAAVFRHLLHRHESLRTSFGMVNEELVQRIHNEAAFKIENYDLVVEKGAGGTRGLAPLSIAFAESTIKDFIRPFDLSKAPLLRVGLIRCRPAVDRCILMVDMHHIVTDGTSMIVFINEIMALYAGKALPYKRIRYKDFSQWQNHLKESGEIKKQADYWKKLYTGDIPVLNLPYDYPRPAVQVYEGGDAAFTIGAKETRDLNSLALEEGVTLFMLIHAILNVMLWKLSSQEDIIIGTPIAGRRHAEIQHVIGMFVNTLALRNYPHPDQSFKAFLAEVKKQTLEAYENQDYQFEELVENVTVNRDLARDPIFSVMFVLQNIEIQEGNVPEVEIPGLKSKPFPYNKGTTKFDMLLGGKETNGMLYLSIQYALKLFKESSIRRYINYIKKIITSILKDRQDKLSAIQLITAEEKHEILYGCNQTTAKYPQNKTIHELYEEQVERTPDHTALVGVHETHKTRKNKDNRSDMSDMSEMSYMSYLTHLSYKELQDRARQLAYILKEKGIGPAGIVAIEAERSMETVIGIFGILTAGAAYMPIDPEYPQERLDYMLNDANVNILVKKDNVFSYKKNKKDLFVLNFAHLQVEFDSKCEFRVSKLSSSSLAYIIYTSGSTGKPKGVLVEHRSVVNILTALQRRYPLLETDAYLLKTSLVFDVSVSELFGWYFKGGRLAVLEQGGEKDPGVILAGVEQWGVTHINFVPSMFSVFIETIGSQNLSRLSSLRYIFLAGEALHPELVERFRKLHTGIPLENIYGPTEATIYAAGYSLSGWNGGPTVPIGKPQPNTRLYILDRQNNVQPVGIPGELCISGIGTARGYLNRPELTAKKFDHDLGDYRDYHDRYPGSYRSYKSYKSYKSYILYKTGDLAQWRPDGNIEYLGRKDHQVKIRGFRVELGEIESRLMKYPGINEAVVTIAGGKGGEGNLCAYIVASPANAASPDKLREYLTQNLPGYMIPAYFVQLERIPLTPGGKIDRESLPGPGHKVDVGYVPPADREEEKLAEIWSRVLGIEKSAVGMNARFFELGGHSLKAALVTAKINKEFKVNLPLVTLFKSPTVRELAGYIKAEGKEALLLKDDNLVLIRKRAHREKNLFLVHAGSGEVEVYAEFCDSMSSVFTCWGIKADRLKDYTPRNLSIEEIAREYTRKIKKVQPCGPYYLAGWCIGGTIAFEMVRQLEAQGEEIGMIALINVLPPEVRAIGTFATFTLETELGLLREHLPGKKIKEEAKKLTGLNQVWPLIVENLPGTVLDTGKIKKIIPAAMLRAIPGSAQTGIKELIYYTNVIKTYLRARSNYIPSGGIRAPVYFFSADREEIRNKENWARYSQKPLEFYKISGDHFSILRAPQVEKLAKRFDHIISSH